MRSDNVPVLQRLKQHPVPRMPRIEALLTADDCILSVETLINGQTLAALVREQGSFTPKMTLDVAQELLITLRALGEQQIVHRDLKLSNIMYYREHYYLIDVNAARQYHEFQESDTRLLGTSGFAAPENYGFAQTDQRSDLYSLGIVLNCLLTGNEPHGPLDAETMTTDQTWAPIIMKATALDPQRRYQSANAMLTALPVWRQSSPNESMSKTRHIRYWWLRIQPTLKVMFWIVYAFFVIAAIGAGFDHVTVTGKVNYWITSFMILGAPVLAHYGNRWLHRHWLSQRWVRYRWWLRAGEALVIILMIDHFS